MWLTILRLLLGALLLASAYFVLSWQPAGIAIVGSLLVGFGLMLAGSLVIGPLLAHWISGFSGRLFFPDEHYDDTPPMYSLAESKVAKEDFEFAMGLYEGIVARYPQETKAWVDMIRIAVVHLHDPNRAKRIYGRGMAALHEDEQKGSLTRLYRGIRSLEEEGPDWTKGRTLPVGESSTHVEPY